MAQHLSGGRGFEIITVFTIISIITIITFALRVYVRLTLVKRSSEDWVAGVGCVLFMLFCALSIAGTYYGIGQHENLIPPADLPIAFKLWWFCEPVYVTGNMAVKLSIALMLLRVVQEDLHRKLIYVVTGIMQVYSVIFLLIFLLQCLPASFFWNRFRGVTDGRCLNPNIIVVTGYVYSTITVFYDWTMALLPWFVVRKLRLDLQTRIMVAVILALGSIASIATLIRIPYVANLGHTREFLYGNTGVSICSCLETGLSIIASSAATLKPLFRKTSSQSGGALRTPTLNLIPITPDGSSSNAISKQRVIELPKAQYDLQFRV